LDLDGTVFEHDKVTLDLLAERAYQPSVVETTQRIVGGRLHRHRGAITGLEGGFGGAARLALGGGWLYLGGRDGVVTACSRGTLNVFSRSRLTDSAQTPGVRVVYLAPSGRLYCGAQSVLHVLSTPNLHAVAKLRGGPGVPVFGNVSSAAEAADGRHVFSGDSRGPAVHVWDTTSWQWLTRIELTSGVGPVCHLAIVPGSRLLAASTECGRFLAFDVDKMPLLCVEEGPGGGALATCAAWPPGSVAVLAQGRVDLRRLEELRRPFIIQSR